MALVASCTNEDVFQQDVEVNDLGNRPIAGQVVLDLNNTPGATRWSGAGFDENDVLGASLMDTWSLDEAGEDKYTDVDYISTNYKFTHNGDGSWISDALFVEGNYYFYMQYNEKMRNRQALTSSIPSVQEIGEAGDASVYANQFFLGYYFIDEESTDRNLPVQMVQAYAYPRINVAYEGAKEDLVIDKIVVSSDNLILDRKLSAASALDGVPAYTVVDNKGTEKLDDDVTVVNVGENAQLKAYLAGFNAHKAFDKDAEVPAVVKQAVMAALVANAEEATPIEVKPAEPAATVNGAIIVPAGDYDEATTTLTLEIYTNKGTVTAVVPVAEETIKEEGKADRVVRKNQAYHVNLDADEKNDIELKEGEKLTYADYVAIDAQAFPFSILPAEGGKSKQINVSFLDGAIQVPTELTTGDAEELGYYLTEWYAGRTDLEEGLTVNLTASIELNSDIMGYLNDAANPVVTFVDESKDGAAITIPATADAAMINKINVAAENGPAVIVAEGATQKIVPTSKKNADNSYTVVFDPAYSAGIVNNGTLSVDREGDWQNVANAKLTANITNNGTFTLVDANLTGNVTNKGTFTATANTVTGVVTNESTLNVKAVSGTVHNSGTATITNVTTLYNMGTATVSEAATIYNGVKESASKTEHYSAAAALTIKSKVTSSVTNYGKVDFQGASVASFTNSRYVDEGKPNNSSDDIVISGELTLNANMDVADDVENSGTIIVSEDKGLYIGGSLTNDENGIVKNNSTIFTVEFDNAGTLYHYAGATTTVNENTGTIYIYEANPTSLHITTQSATVKYTTADADFEGGALKALWAPITELTIAQAGTWDLSALGANVVDLIVKKKSSLTFAANESLNKLEMQEGGTLNSNLTVASLVLPANKNLDIALDVTLTYTGTNYDAAGRVNALGWFLAPNDATKGNALVYGNQKWGTDAAI